MARGCKRFDYEYNEKEDWYDFIDIDEEFGPWSSLSEHDIAYLTDFMNKLQFRVENLEAELSHKKEEIRQLMGMPNLILIHDLTEDIHTISNILGFLIQHGLEAECVEYESETIKNCLDRLLKVMEEYEWEIDLS